MSDPYSILGVDRNATDEDVKKAYRKLSRQYHPDANINNPKKMRLRRSLRKYSRLISRSWMNVKKDILPDMVQVMAQVMEATVRLEDSEVLVLMDMVRQEVRAELPG